MRLKVSDARVKRIQVLPCPWWPPRFSLLWWYFFVWVLCFCCVLCVLFCFSLVLFNQYTFQLSASWYHGSIAKCEQPSNASGYSLEHISSIKLYLEFLGFAHTSNSHLIMDLWKAENLVWKHSLCFHDFFFLFFQNWACFDGKPISFK